MHYCEARRLGCTEGEPVANIPYGVQLVGKMLVYNSMTIQKSHGPAEGAWYKSLVGIRKVFISFFHSV